jgi:hypothetical protein
MRKFSVLVFLCIIVLNIFSVDKTDVFMGVVYGAIFDFNENTARPAGTSPKALGLMMLVYGFFDNKQPGLFLYMNGIVPLPNQGAISHYEAGMMETTIGPGFKLEPNHVVALEYGLGFNFLWEGAEWLENKADQYSLLSTGLGIGGNTHLKLNITDAFYIGAGVHIAWTLVDWTLVESPPDNSSRWMFNTSIGIKPYIGFGWNTYRERVGRGRQNKSGTTDGLSAQRRKSP